MCKCTAPSHPGCQVCEVAPNGGGEVVMGGCDGGGGEVRREIQGSGKEGSDGILTEAISGHPFHLYLHGSYLHPVVMMTQSRCTRKMLMTGRWLP